MPFGLLKTQVGPGNHVLDGCSNPPMGRGNFESAKGLPIVKYRDTLQSPVQKRLNWLICHLGCGLRWAKGSTSSIVFSRWHKSALVGGHIGATCWIWLNRLSALAMRSYVNLLWPLVNISRPRKWYLFTLILSSCCCDKGSIYVVNVHWQCGVWCDRDLHWL